MSKTNDADERDNKACDPDNVRFSISRRAFLSLLGVSVLGMAAYTIFPSTQDTQNVPDPKPQVYMGSSIAIVAAELVEREANRGWYILSTESLLNTFDVNRRSFQIGLIDACASVVKMMNNNTANKDFTSIEDVDLSNAVFGLSYKENLEAKNPTLPSAEKGFRLATQALRNYNSGVLAGKSRPIEPKTFLERISDHAASRMDKLHQSLTQQAENGWYIGENNQAAYYQTIGTLYGYNALYQAMSVDCASVIRKLDVAGSGNCFNRAVVDLDKTSTGAETPIQRCIVNGSKKHSLVGSDLYALADRVSLVRGSLREVAARVRMIGSPAV